jgi:hypothetical protein
MTFVTSELGFGPGCPTANTQEFTIGQARTAWNADPRTVNPSGTDTVFQVSPSFSLWSRRKWFESMCSSTE